MELHRSAPKLRVEIALAVIGACALVTLVAGVAGCRGPNDGDPVLLPGGGVTAGAIRGVLNVYVVDDAGIAIPGAAVIVTGEDEPLQLAGVTDASGLVRFEDRDLRGHHSVSAGAPGFAPVTWFGVAGASVTLPLAPPGAAVSTADVRGTITGFDLLPAPAPLHEWRAVVGYSVTRDLLDPANQIPPPVDGLGAPENMCVHTMAAVTCDWHLVTRTGTLALFYALYDVDTMAVGPGGAPLVGWGVLPGLAFGAGDTFTGLALPAPTMSVVTVDITLGNEPPGLLDVSAGGRVELPTEDGLLSFGLADTFGAIAIPLNLPDLTGDLGGGTYTLEAIASEAPGGAGARSGIVARDIDATTAAVGVAMGDFMAPPAALDLVVDTLWFDPPGDAGLIVAGVTDALGASVWAAMQLEVFTFGALLYPAGLTDLGMGLPSGTLTFTVTGLKTDGKDPLDFTLDGELGSVKLFATSSVVVDY